ncbi:MAG: hypothetical protein AB1716_17385, partial [Planctomycetota bacterium]
RHPFESSVLSRYIPSSQHRILECPTIKRVENKYFDYTAVIRLAGAKVDLPWFMTYPENCTTLATRMNTARRFTAIPLLIEEDTRFYNANPPVGDDDGSFANADQFGDHHNDRCHIGYLNGTAGRFKSPKGRNRQREEAQDLVANHLRLVAKGRQYEVGGSYYTEWGWANEPR